MKTPTEELRQDKQEPVAWRVYYETNGHYTIFQQFPAGLKQHDIEPLYTSPPKRQPLSDEAIRAVYYSQLGKFGQLCDMDDIEFFARSIEAAHGITNEP